MLRDERGRLPGLLQNRTVPAGLSFEVFATRNKNRAGQLEQVFETSALEKCKPNWKIFGEVLALVPRILVESLSACHARVQRNWAVRPKRLYSLEKLHLLKRRRKKRIHN